MTPDPTKDSVFPGVPDMLFFNVVKLFAMDKGIVILTWNDQWMAFGCYIEFSIRQN